MSTARRQLDETGNALRDAGSRIRAVPRGGWIAAIRDALAMSTQDLAGRLGVTRASVAKLEASERRRTIRLETLQRAADALDCDLIYALVPRRPLQDLVDARRLEIFDAMQKRTQQHMHLEAQGVPDGEQSRQRLREAESLVPDRLLWRKQD